MNQIPIVKRAVGEGEPTFVIAEAGVNHNGSVDTALKLIDAAADAGCDAVKFQKRDIRALLSREAYEKPYQNGGHSYGTTYGEHRQNMELGRDDYRKLARHARERGILFMASAWDHYSAAFLDSLGVPAHKIGSPDLTNLPLIAHVASFGKPVILSTGMSELEEIDAAVQTVLRINTQLILMHCVSTYPTEYQDVGLGCINLLRDRYKVHVGYSGHEPGWHAVLAAVALGACAIEKHITLDRAMKGGDHRFSLEPDEVRDMVRQIRDVEEALIGKEKRLLEKEIPFRRKLGKSLTARVPIQKGMMVTPDMLTCKSPATGVSPILFNRVVGRRAARDIEADSVLGKEDVQLT